jgi:hypothetical protein
MWFCFTAPTDRMIKNYENGQVTEAVTAYFNVLSGILKITKIGTGVLFIF